MQTYIRRIAAWAAGGMLFAGTISAQQAPSPQQQAASSQLTLAQAKSALAAAAAAAAKMNVALSCAVVDARGDLIAFERMDNARFFTASVAQGKARASAVFRAPSGTLANLNTSGIGNLVEGPVLFLQGAVPIMRNNQAIGAIGCSGAASQQDEDAAKAGLGATAQ